MSKKPITKQKNTKAASKVVVKGARKSGMSWRFKVISLAAAFLLIGTAGYLTLRPSDALTKIPTKECIGIGRRVDWEALRRGDKKVVCKQSCQTGAGRLVKAQPYNICSNAASKISSYTCANKGRVWFPTVKACAKQFSGGEYGMGASGPKGSRSNNACINPSNYYIKASPHDYCSRSRVMKKK